MIYGKPARLLAVALMSFVAICQALPGTAQGQAQGHSKNRPRTPMPPGCRRVDTADSGVYTVEWLPADIRARSPGSVPVLVTLHGSHGSAAAEVRDWLPYAQANGFAVIALQWWLGEESYLPPPAVYARLDDRLLALSREFPALSAHKAMLAGFSRGSAILPALADLDNRTGKHLYSMYVLNSGAWPPDHPPAYVRAVSARNERTAFAGEHFALYFGGRDETWGGRALDFGRNLKAFLTGNGGVVDVHFESPAGRHGDFVGSGKMVSTVLAIWQRLNADR